MKNKEETLVTLVEFSTAAGYKTVELHNADISSFHKPVDLVVTSAKWGRYLRTKNSLIGALNDNLNISVSDLALDKLIDLRKSMGTWVSQKVQSTSFSYLLCVESLNKQEKFFNREEVFINLFSTIALLEYHNISVKSVIMPVIGSGYVGIDTRDIIPRMMVYARKALNNNIALQKIYIVEQDESKIEDLLLGVNTYLKEDNPDFQDEFDIDDILAKQLLIGFKKLQLKNFVYQNNETVSIIINRLEKKDLRIHEFGVLSRKFVEHALYQILGEKQAKKLGSPYNQVEGLKNLGISQWIQNYFHAVRIIGNSTVHSNNSKENQRSPSNINIKDMQALIVILNCIVDFLLFFNTENK
ncbi:MAG: DUF4145 domain-containing protein [Bernardetiaceae bacterium]|nr:DUF4145 domain-containing protein [Bernardetiaceae bacterium]